MFHPRGPSFFELARQALSSTEEGYDLLAAKFDFTPYRTPDAVLDAVKARIAADGPVPAALDVCCGTGAGLSMLEDVVTDRLVGVDMSEGMLAQAEKNLAALRQKGTPALELLRGDALALPFDAEFDVVTCFGAFGHILEADEPRFVDNIARVLKPGGRFVFATSEMPPVLSSAYLVSRGFNAAIRVRNAIFPKAFVMFYLTFLLPRARALLEARGLKVEHTPLSHLPPPYNRLHVVVATKAES